MRFGAKPEMCAHSPDGHDELGARRVKISVLAKDFSEKLFDHGSFPMALKRSLRLSAWDRQQVRSLQHLTHALPLDKRPFVPYTRSTVRTFLVVISAGDFGRSAVIGVREYNKEGDLIDVLRSVPTVHTAERVEVAD